jgi:alkylation response protein AidB-like acyl-CoA dehydrogenase
MTPGIEHWRASADAGSACFADAVAEFMGRYGPRRSDADRLPGGPEDVALFAEKTPEAEVAETSAARDWQRILYQAGLGWLSGPARFGGAELPWRYENIFRAVEQQFTLPSRRCLGIGTSMVGPTIEKHGTVVAKEKYLRPIYRGDAIACELLSEPDAGSDLANVQTRAWRDGRKWVLNGQKVWTSGAHYSDVGQAICRTAPDAPKHHNVSVFLVDMHSPGLTIRPLRQMTGGALFNEVFLDDVVVDDDFRLGEVNGGWAVTRTTLLFERRSIAAGEGRANTDVFRMDRLVQMLRDQGLAEDPVLRRQLVDLYIRVEVARLATAQVGQVRDSSAGPGPELSAGKLALSDNYERLADFVTAVLGPKATADTGEAGCYLWSKLILGAVGFRIAGGTDEIIRNIIGERVLGLPREPAAT